METSIEEFEKWLANPEAHNLEFKAARSSFDSNNDLPKYCAGIANSGGGKLILGVDDERQVVGSQAFQNNTNSLSQDLFQQIAHHVEVEELLRPQGRVVIFQIPQRRIGIPVSFKGRYLMRRGSSLVEMDQQTLRSILNEVEPDFSAQVVPELKFKDLDARALETLRSRWATKANRPEFNSIPLQQVLQDLELSDGEELTYAAVILVGSGKALSRHLACAEIIFEWRSNKDQVHYDARKTWREPYLLTNDEIVSEVEARNYRFPLQEGMFQRDIYAFDEKSIREAVNNAVAHRDYQLNPSTFIKVSPEGFFIQSPGGFPHGVTPENILSTTNPRNRRLAETMNKIGFVERAGQGLDDIFRKTISAGKGIPIIRADGHFWVNLYIPAQVRDMQFLKFIERIIAEKQLLLSVEELIALDVIRCGGKLSAVFKDKFLQYGLVERVGTKGRGVSYVLSHAFYVATNQRGEYTRRTGLDREEQKQLILKHLKKNGSGAMHEFMQILPQLSRDSIATLMRGLKQQEQVVFEGTKKWGVWKIK